MDAMGTIRRRFAGFRRVGVGVIGWGGSGATTSSGVSRSLYPTFTSNTPVRIFPANLTCTQTR